MGQNKIREMKHLSLITILVAFAISSCESSGEPAEKKALSKDQNEAQTPCCSNNCIAESKSAEPSCKLTTPELQKRKETVLESLKKQIIEKKELKDGYAFKFAGTDKMLDELTEFIKTERECCDFFTFTLSVSGDKSEIWLELTGGEETKDFILGELELE